MLRPCALVVGLVLLAPACRGPRSAAEGYDHKDPTTFPSRSDQSSQAPELGGALGLDLVLNLAEERAIDLDLARAREEAAAAELQIARAAWIPELSFSADTWHNDGSVQATDGAFQTVDKRFARSGLGLSLELDLGDALYAPRAARSRLAARHSLTEAARQAARERAALLFLDLLEAQLEGEITREAGAHAAELERVAGARFRGGRGLEVDYQSAVAHRAEVDAMVIEAERRRIVAAARLARHLDLDPARGWEAMPPLELEEWAEPGHPQTDGGAIGGPEDTAEPSLVERAQHQRPELAAARANLRAAHLDATGESRQWLLPTIGASVFRGEFGPELNEGSDSEVTAVGVTWNLGLAMVGQSRLARARKRAARLDLDLLHRIVQSQVVEASALLDAAASRLSLADLRLTAAETASHLALQRHEAGAGLLLEALAAQTDLFRARSAVVGARMDRMRASWILARAVGE